MRKTQETLTSSTLSFFNRFNLEKKRKREKKDILGYSPTSDTGDLEIKI